MQSTAPCTLTLKIHRAAYLHVCILVKIILHEIHTQRVLFSLGGVEFFGCVLIEMQCIHRLNISSFLPVKMAARITL